ncbi:HNH endonuclease [Vibrio crassostreae]|uniref:HNH endonuclease n=1 Tax=Vibrio crassostreae TaxID=246167 RepID=UPI00104D4E6A|nr:HNH endonuclease [Vibrio crassostreae]
MIKLTLPNTSFIDSYDTCLRDIPTSEVNLLTKLRSARVAISTQSAMYSVRAQTNNLHLFEHLDQGRPHQIAIVGGSGITKGELVNLYSDTFLNPKNSCRYIYDEIKLSSSGHCSLCITGTVSTLDHVLPKAYYPVFSVDPQNLVPACSDCNKGKGSSLLRTKSEHALHPYFSDQIFYDENWLYAEVHVGTPVVVTFSVAPPAHWTDLQKEVVRNHFNSFKLGAKYSIFVTSHISSAIDTVENMINNNSSTVADIKTHFSEMAAKRSNVNSPVKIMFEALARSDWFCSSPRKHSNFDLL